MVSHKVSIMMNKQYNILYVLPTEIIVYIYAYVYISIYIYIYIYI